MTALLAFGIQAAIAQTGADEEKSKKEKRAERLKESREKLVQLTKDSTLILEANVLRNRYNHTFPATGNNFVLIDGDRVVLQTASTATGRPGSNGLGGVTLRGRITGYEYDIDNKGPIHIVANVVFNGTGFATLQINVSPDGYATAIYRDNWGRRVTFSGSAEDPENSRVFEGMPVL